MMSGFSPGIGALLAACNVFLDECKCPLCDQHWRKASTFPCGHTFCYDCAMATLEGPGISQSECPNCKEKFWKKELKANPQMIAVVEHTQRLIAEAASALSIHADGRAGATEGFLKHSVLLGQIAVSNPVAGFPQQGAMARLAGLGDEPRRAGAIREPCKDEAPLDRVMGPPEDIPGSQVQEAIVTHLRSADTHLSVLPREKCGGQAGVAMGEGASVPLLDFAFRRQETFGVGAVAPLYTGEDFRQDVIPIPVAVTAQGSVPEAVQPTVNMPVCGTTAAAPTETPRTQLLAPPLSQPGFCWPSLSQGRHLGTGAGCGVQPFGSLASLRWGTQNVNKGYLDFHALLEQAVTQMAVRTEAGWQEPPARVVVSASHGAEDNGVPGHRDFDDLAWLRSVSELPGPTDQEREALDFEQNIVAMFLEELDQQIEEERDRLNSAAVVAVEEGRVQLARTSNAVDSQPLLEHGQAGPMSKAVPVRESACAKAEAKETCVVESPGRLPSVPQGTQEVTVLPCSNAHRQVDGSEQPFPTGNAPSTSKLSAEALTSGARRGAVLQGTHNAIVVECHALLKMPGGGEVSAPVGRTGWGNSTAAVAADHTRVPRASDDGTVGDILAGPLLETHQDESEPVSMEDDADLVAMQGQRQVLFPACLEMASSPHGGEPDSRHWNKRLRTDADGSNFGMQRPTPLRSPHMPTGGDVGVSPSHVNATTPAAPDRLASWFSPRSRGVVRGAHAMAAATPVATSCRNEAPGLSGNAQGPAEDGFGSTIQAPNGLAGTPRLPAAGEATPTIAAAQPPSPAPRTQDRPAGASEAPTTAVCNPPEAAPMAAAPAPAGWRKTAQRKRHRSEPPPAVARRNDNVTAEQNQHPLGRKAAQAQAQPMAPAAAQRTARRGRERSSAAAAAADTVAPLTTGETAGGGTGARRGKPVYVCTTAIAPSDRSKPRELARRIRGVELSEDVTPSLTHMVISLTDKGLAGARTVKYLRAVMQGCWVVGVEWVEACLAAGQLVPEAPYEAKGDTTHEGAPAKGRLRLARGEPPLFRGVKFCLTYLKQTTEGGYSRPDLEALLQAGGGVLVRRPPQRLAPAATTAAAALFGTLALADPYDSMADPGSSSTQPMSEADTSGSPVPFGVPRVAVLLAPRDHGEAVRVVREWGCAPIEATWVFDSISHYRIMPVEPYTLAIASS